MLKLCQGREGVRVRELAFSLVLRVARLLWGTGVSKRFPLVGDAFRFAFTHLRPMGVELVEVEGNRMYISRGDVDVRLQHGASLFYDPQDKALLSLFKEMVRPGMTVLDIGAHIGYHTLLAARLVGEEGRVFAFEPAPDTYALLRQNIALNGYQNIIPVPKAVSNQSGQVRLFLNEYNSGRHNLYDHYRQKGNYVEVESVTLDEFFAGQDISVDFIKMDIEGAEMAALQGMEKLIRSNKNLKLITEFNPGFLRSAGYSPEEFLGKLTEYGFKLYNINSKEERIEPCELTSLLRGDNARGTVNLLCVREG